MLIADGIRTDDVEISLGDQEEKAISLKSNIVLEPIMKFVDGFWMGANHDISLKYNEDFSKVYLKNYTGCATPLKLKVRLVKVDKNNKR